MYKTDNKTFLHGPYLRYTYRSNGITLDRKTNIIIYIILVTIQTTDEI